MGSAMTLLVVAVPLVCVVVLALAGARTLLLVWVAKPLQDGDRATAMARATTVERSPLLRRLPHLRVAAAVVRVRVHLADGPLSAARAQAEALVEALDRTGSPAQPNNEAAEARLLLGIALLQSGRYEEASDHLRAVASSTDPFGDHFRASALRMRAAADMRRGRFAEAQAHLDQVDRDHGGTSPVPLATKMRANLAYAQQDWAGAAALFRSCIDEHRVPTMHWSDLMDLVITMRMLACACAHQGDQAAARSWQQRAVTTSQSRPDAARFTNHAHFAATCALLDATVQRLAGDRAAAVTLAARAVRAFDDLDEDQQCFAIREEGRARATEGDIATARVLLQQAAGWFADHHAVVEAERTRTELAALPPT